MEKKIPRLAELKEQASTVSELHKAIGELLSDANPLGGVTDKPMVLHAYSTAMSHVRLLRDIVRDGLIPISSKWNVLEEHRKLLDALDAKIEELRRKRMKYQRMPVDRLDLESAKQEILSDFKDIHALSDTLRTKMITGYVAEILDRHGLVDAIEERFGEDAWNKILQGDILSELVDYDVSEPRDVRVARFLAHHAFLGASNPEDAIRAYFNLYSEFSEDPSIRIVSRFPERFWKSIDPESARKMFSGITAKDKHIDLAVKHWTPELEKIILEDPGFLRSIKHYGRLAEAGFSKRFAIQMAKFLHDLGDDNAASHLVSMLTSVSPRERASVEKVPPSILWALYRKGIHPRDAPAVLAMEKHGIPPPEAIEIVTPRSLPVVRALSQVVAPLPTPVVRKLLQSDVDPAHLQYLFQYLPSGKIPRDQWPVILEGMREIRGKAISRFWENLDLLPHLEREYIRLVSRPDAGEILPLIRKIARRGGDLRAIVARSHDRRTLLSAALLADMGYALDSDVIHYTPHLFQAITGHDVEEYLKLRGAGGRSPRAGPPRVAGKMVDLSNLAALLAEVHAQFIDLAKREGGSRVRSSLINLLDEWLDKEGGKVLRRLLEERGIPLHAASPDHVEMLVPSIRQRVLLSRNLLKSLYRPETDKRRRRGGEKHRDRAAERSDPVSVLTGAVPILKKISREVEEGNLLLRYDPQSKVLIMRPKKVSHESAAVARLRHIASYVRLYNAQSHDRIPEYKAQNFGPEVRVYAPKEFYAFLVKLAEKFPDHRGHLLRLADAIGREIKSP